MDANLKHEQEVGSPLQHFLGYTLTEWEPDRAVVTLTLRQEHLTRSGTMHGGVIAMLADAAGGYCGCHCAEPGTARYSVSLSLTVDFVAAIRGGTVVAEGWRIGGGRTIFFGRVEIRDDGGQLCATASGTFRYIGSRS